MSLQIAYFLLFTGMIIATSTIFFIKLLQHIFTKDAKYLKIITGVFLLGIVAGVLGVYFVKAMNDTWYAQYPPGHPYYGKKWYDR